MKRLVLMVEGKGDAEAAKRLAVKSLEQFHPDWRSFFFIDDHLIKVGDVCSLLSPKEGIKLLRHIERLGKQADIGGVLVLLDGDADSFLKLSDDGRSAEKAEFCPATTAFYMSDLVKKGTRAGKTFSFAVVFANQEFESWFLAGHPDFEADYIGQDLEKHPRNAKGEIKKYDPRYNEAIDQHKYVNNLDLGLLLERMRSFRRFKSALEEIYQSIQSGQSICSPSQ